ncbi:hypothetical protein C1H46_028901 [Malus baccata]|uniref:Uncharacterized protein n=1 Tax=Malus baccata TaxID=106549 RepID=A0A540LGD3_MALBA|nr:hypothetical protein C1H46_028901 [Malus baccata]
MDSDFDMSAPLEMNKDLDLPYEDQDGSAGKVKDINQTPPPLKVIMENLRSSPQFPWLLGSAPQFHLPFVHRQVEINQVTTP